jgi:hypothetical protein
MGACPRSEVHGDLTPARYVGPNPPANRSASAALISLSLSFRYPGEYVFDLILLMSFNNLEILIFCSGNSLLSNKWFVSPSVFVSSSLSGIGAFLLGARLRISALSADSICSSFNLLGLLEGMRTVSCLCGFCDTSCLCGCSALSLVLDEGSLPGGR